MNLKTLASTIAALGVVIGGFLAVDNRYFLAAQAAELRESMKADIRQSETQLRLEILRMRLSLLNGKARLTKDEEEERAFTRELVKKLQQDALAKP